jgi:hypothetical protein
MLWYAIRVHPYNFPVVAVKVFVAVLVHKTVVCSGVRDGAAGRLGFSH